MWPHAAVAVIRSRPVLCPHALTGDRDPNACSQCRGVVARRVTVTDRGQMVIDGVPAGRMFYVHTPIPRNAVKARARKAKAAADDGLDPDDDID